MTEKYYKETQHHKKVGTNTYDVSLLFVGEVVGPLGAHWGLLGPVGAHWCLLRPIGAHWDLLGPVGAHWGLLGPVGRSLLTYMRRCRAHTRPMEPFWSGPQITSTVGCFFARELRGNAWWRRRRRGRGDTGMKEAGLLWRSMVRATKR